MQVFLSTSLMQESLAELTECRALASFSNESKKCTFAALIPTFLNFSSLPPTVQFRNQSDLVDFLRQEP